MRHNLEFPRNKYALHTLIEIPRYFYVWFLSELRIISTNAWCSIELKDILSPNEPIKEKSEDWIIDAVKKRVMPDATASHPLSLRSLKHINRSLGEVVEHYRTAHKRRLSPASLLTFLESKTRWLVNTWKLDINILTDAVFNDDDDGYINAANRLTARQQANGERTQPYNSLTDKDAHRILSHKVTNRNEPAGHVYRIMVVVGLLLGLRP